MKSILAEAEALSREAGKIAMHYFQQPLTIERKEDQSPVTEADREIELFLRQALSQRYPDHGILGEEWGEIRPESDWQWILDPIDGTRSFARGIPIFGIQLALAYRKKPILGVIHLPALGEHIAALEGHGCHWNGKPCFVSKRSAQEAVVHAHEWDLINKQSPDLFQWLSQREHLRNWGDCYSFVLLATGRIEAALDPRMQIWDSAPLPVLIKEAGGIFMDWQEQDSIWSGQVIAGTPEIISQIKPILRT